MFIKVSCTLASQWRVCGKWSMPYSGSQHPSCAIPSAVLSQSDRLGPLRWRSWQEKVPATALVIATTVGKFLPSITLKHELCFKDS